MATFGYTSGTPPNLNTASTNYKQVTKYTLATSAEVTKLTIYFSGTSQICPLRGLIYADSSGPAALQGVTNESTTINDSIARWIDFTFPTPISLTAGDWWLGLIAGSPQAQVGVDNAAGNLTYKAETYSGSPADPFGTPAGSQAGAIGVYATYPDTQQLRTVASPLRW